VLRSDSVYMFPPFLAYYAAVHNDAALLNRTVRQLELYRAGLQRGSGAWSHIQGGNADNWQWSSGNGWAAYGMTRVLATIQNGPWSSAVKAEYVPQLTTWIKEIIDGAMRSSVSLIWYVSHSTAITSNIDKRASNGLLHNYLDDSSSLPETSGTSLLAATVYRMAVLAPSVFNSSYLAWAQSSVGAISRNVGADGVIAPAVNPYSYRSNTPYTAGSPEGQAWALSLYAARRDCIASEIC
jgi:rhamnogalacturonyl hydrolase YesR